MKRIKPFYILLLAYVLSLAVNLDYFIRSPKTDSISWLHLLVSIVYIVCWVLYLLKEEKHFGVVMSIIMLVVSLAGYVIAKGSFDVGFFIPIALLLITPFAGLMELVAVPLVWLLISAICIIFAIIGVIKPKQI